MDQDAATGPPANDERYDPAETDFDELVVRVELIESTLADLARHIELAASVLRGFHYERENFVHDIAAASAVDVRTTFFDQRRKLMQQWATFATGMPIARVVKFGGR